MMFKNMRFQIAGLDKGHITNITCEWFVSSMNTSVFGEILGLTKGTVTQLALVSLLARVSSQVTT